MIDENAELIQEILFNQLKKVETELLAAFPQDVLKERLTIQTRYEGCGRVDAILSFQPGERVASESIDLAFSIYCTAKGAIFASELAWSGGRTIEEVVVCEICADCLEDLHQRVGDLSERIRPPLLARMIDLFTNFVAA